MKKLLYILVLALVLTGCGKANEKKEQANKTEQKETMAEEDTSQGTEESSEDVSEAPSNNTEESSQKDSQNEEDSKPSNSASQTSNQKTETTTNNTAQNSNTTSQKPSNNSSQNSNQGTNQSTTQKPSSNTTQTPTRKPVKRVSEEVKSAEVAYKYGVTKYDITTNYYTLYSDDSKELIDSSSYTVYNSSNYSAADSELRGEADSNASKYLSYYQEVLRLVNEIRATAGVAPLTLDTTLCKAASMRALEMDYSNEMSHTRPSGKDCFSVLDFYSASYGTCGENIAAGQTSASSVVNGWKNSPGHYQNMINASFTKLGVGYSFTGVGDYGYYWCQLFTN